MRKKIAALIVLLGAHANSAAAQQDGLSNPNPPPPVVTMPPRPAAGAQDLPPSEPLRPIARTHTIPHYPPESVAAQEQGYSVFDVHITTAGMADNCIIVQSSGSARLDQAACDHVRTVWRWKPPTLHGQPMAVSLRVSIRWDLRNAKPPQ